MSARRNALPSRRVLGAAVWVGAATFAAAAGVRLVEVTSDPPVASGKQVWSFRMTPSETREYDQIVFECVLRQEYQKKSSDGTVRRVVAEPATFVHREKNVRMVAELDKHISFWVPLGMEDIQRAYGKLFQTNAPVTVARFRITAVENGKDAWTIEVPTAGVHTFE